MTRTKFVTRGVVTKGLNFGVKQLELVTLVLTFDHGKAEVHRGDTLYLLLICRVSSKYHGIILEPTNKANGQFYRRGYFGGRLNKDLESQCKDSINKLKESEYESAEPHPKFGHVYTITLI
jgi:hypothetical protein